MEHVKVQTMSPEVFCLLLHERLGTLGFVEGAFVCGDPTGRLHRLLRAKSHPRPVARTHCVFVRRKNVVLRGDESEQHECVFEDAILPHASALGAFVRNEYMRLVLFYSFRAVLPDGSTPRYTYVKLERWPCLSAMHAVEAFQTYVLGMPCCAEQPHRCESTRYGLWEQDSAFMSKLGQKAFDEFNEYNMCVRAGNEFFVPSSLTQWVIDQAVWVT
jgi:hypothetical protein